MTEINNAPIGPEGLATTPTTQASMPSASAVITPQLAKAEIAGLIKDQNFQEQMRLGDHEAIKKWTALNQQAAPGEMSAEFGHKPDNYDQIFGVPPSPDDYQHVGSLRLHGQELTPETESTDAAFRKSVHAAGFNNEGAASLAEALRQASRQISFMKTRDEYQDWASKQTNDLHVVWQGNLKNNLNVIHKFLTEQVEPKVPGTLKMLAESPSAASARVLTMLFDQATRFNGHKEGKW